MARWFWYFMIYSFLGYCLEKLFARAVRSPKQVRKCFLLLPLCPVYGLSMTLLVVLSGEGLPLPLQLLAGGAVCTGVEYLVHLFYDKTLSVRFWDYTAMPRSICGRVCPEFSLIWAALSTLAVVALQPAVAAAVELIPPAVTFGVWMLLAVDGVLTWQVLAKTGDTERLRLFSL